MDHARIAKAIMKVPLLQFAIARMAAYIDTAIKKPILA
jgi:hypothetical protein